MIANKHVSKIIIIVTAVAVVLCLLAMVFSEKLTESLGGTGVKMEYESKLFDTDEIMTVDILMDEDEWNQMLQNAMTEEYYACDVVVNGKKFENVGIRPKGNTSLSAIAMDPDTDRYSLKLEFDHFVEGQTCFGLDKLILNNNYADATNMKEAVIYDMYQYLGADASLYNYAKVSLNGEYWGIYLALEGVEQSFMLRNFGTQDGELYKPDSMEMGGDSSSGSSSGSDKMTPPSGDGNGKMEFPGGNGRGNGSQGEGGRGNGSQGEGGRGSGSQGKDGRGSDSQGKDGMPSGGGPAGGFPGGGEGFGGFDPSQIPSGGEGFGGFELPEGFEGFDPSQIPSGGEGFGGFELPEGFDSSQLPSSGNFGGFGGGFSRGGGGANLNYSDDDLDSYSTIWEGEITGTSTADHRRVVTALKNISEGKDLEKYLDVDNVLKYMAVHAFAVNMDSLSGSMAHNYYLYEYKGQLNLFPWDYNLSFGGMSMGSSGDATEMVNDAIDTPFSGTKFFDALLENEEYRERYHQYLQQLVDEYVYGGRFDEVYNRIRNQIDSLVETDPTAFYGYDEYLTAADMLHQTIMLRAESIEGQLDGTIPSTDSGQKADSSKLVDASAIDVKAMGQFSMGGFSDNVKGRKRNSTDEGSTDSSGKTGEGSSESSGKTGERSSDSASASSENGASPDGRPSGGKFSPDNMPDGMEFNFDGEMPSAGKFGMGNMPGIGGSKTSAKNLLTLGICFVVMLAALIFVSVFKRRRFTKK